MKRYSFYFVVWILLICSFVSCKRNISQNNSEALLIYEAQNKEKKDNNEKIVDILRNMDTEKNSDQILPYEYIYFYGKTKDEIINNLGDNYVLLNKEKIPEEYGWGYTQKERIKYPGITFGILLNEDTSKVDNVNIYGNNVKYVGNIFVGCSVDDVVNQLGKPTSIDIVVKNFIYFSQNIRISFKITHEEKIKEIYISDYSESYNLDFNPKDQL